MLNSFKFHTFNKNKFSATNFLSKVDKNTINQEINLNTIRAIQLTNNVDNNLKIKRKLLEKNLEEELSTKNNNNDNNNNNNNDKNNIDINSNYIKKILLQMLTFNSYLPNEEIINTLKRSKNDLEFSNIISCFQLLMKYLFELKENINNQNDLLEKKISVLKGEENLLNDNININKDKISKLEKRKIQLQSFLKSNGKEINTKKNKLYVCNVCPFPYKKFYEYRDFHRHYVKKHINPYLCIGNDYTIINKGFDKDYFDQKMNEITEDVEDMFRKAKSTKKIRVDNDFKEMKNNINFILRDKKYKGIRRNKRYETVRPNTNTSLHLNNTNTFRNNSNEIKNEFIRKRIEFIKYNQNHFELNFQNQIESFLKDFKNEINKLRQNQFNQK